MRRARWIFWSVGVGMEGMFWEWICGVMSWFGFAFRRCWMLFREVVWWGVRRGGWSIVERDVSIFLNYVGFFC